MAPVTGSQGCDNGFWRKIGNLLLWVSYSPGDSFDSVFGVQSSFGGTLLDALDQKGGAEKALAKEATAALLNASSPLVHSGYTVSQVIVMVQDAYESGDFETAKKALEDSNKESCPLK